MATRRAGAQPQRIDLGSTPNYRNANQARTFIDGSDPLGDLTRAGDGFWQWPGYDAARFAAWLADNSDGARTLGDLTHEARGVRAGWFLDEQAGQLLVPGEERGDVEQDTGGLARG